MRTRTRTTSDRVRSGLLERYARVCDALVETPVGRSLRWTYDYNILLVDGDRAGLTASDIAAMAAREQAGLADHCVEVLDEELAARLAPGLAALGFEQTRLIALEADVAAIAAEDAAVSEVSAADVADLRAEWIRSLPWGGEEAMVAHMLATDAALAERLPTRIFAVEGAAFARVVDFPQTGATEVESVYCVPRARGRGLAARAVRGALAHSSEPAVFVLTDDGSPAEAFYERLGFTRTGVVSDFRRRVW